MSQFSQTQERRKDEGPKARDFNAEATSLVSCLSYYPGLHPNAREWFVHSIAGMLKMAQGIDLLGVEQKYHLLERFEHLPDLALRRNPGQELTYANIYRDVLVPQWASAASFLAVYDKLERLGEVDLGSVQKMLDLGCGYWNSAASYDLALPQLKIAIGLDWSAEKIGYFSRECAAVFKIDVARFQVRHSNFFDIADDKSATSSEIAAEGPLDLVLMQNYFPQNGGHLTHTPSDYGKLFAAIGERLAENGKLVIIVDKRDYVNSHELENLRPTLERAFRLYEDKRITPAGAFGLPQSLDIHVWVGDKKALAGF